jgi:hypothetical protein
VGLDNPKGNRKKSDQFPRPIKFFIGGLSHLFFAFIGIQHPSIPASQHPSINPSRLASYANQIPIKVILITHLLDGSCPHTAWHKQKERHPTENGRISITRTTTSPTPLDTHQQLPIHCPRIPSVITHRINKIHSSLQP